MAVNRSKALGKSTINIKSESIQGHIGASKYSNDDWGTIAYFIPRSNIQKQFIEKELQYAGIYFLVGYEGNSEKIYVGQAKKRNNGESFLKRLREHDKSKTEPYRYIWQYIIVVTNKNDAWDDSIASSLERIYYHKIPKQNRLNGNEPRGELEIDYDDKVRQIDAYVSIIGLDIFADKSIDDTKEIQVESITNEYTAVEDLQSGMARIPEIVTPSKVVKAMVNMLPEHIFNPDTKFIDLACKGGEYLRELYERLMESESVVMEYPNLIERSNHILTEQLYGIALSKVSLERTTTKLFGFGYNIRILQNYISLLKGRVVDRVGNKITLQEILNEEYGKDMKFDVIIGNPPYQDGNGSGNGGGATAFYDKFVLNSFDLSSRYISFITPARWYTDEKKVLALKEKLLSCNNVVELHDYPNTEEVFKGVYIMGGVCYYLIDKDFNGLCKVIEHRDGEKIESIRPLKEDFSDIFIRNSDALNIVNKVVKHPNGFVSMYNYINDYNVFGLRSYVRGNLVKTNATDLKLYYTGNDSKGGGIGYIQDDFMTHRELIKGHKVYINSVSDNMLSFPYKTLYKGFYGEPNSVCTESYLTIGPLKNREVAEKLIKYLATKFVRILVQQRKTSQLAYKKVYRFVPVQDLSNTSDIDWSQSIDDIDKQLYAKYNLSEEEISYIEKTIKAIPGANQSSQPSNQKLDIQAYEAAAMNMALKNS